MDAFYAQAAAEPGRLFWFLAKIAGLDDDAIRRCPHDWGHVRAVAWLMISAWAYIGALFALIGHTLFALPGQIRPDLVIGAMFLATFFMQIDSYQIMRSGWYLSGIAELKRGGLDISGGPGPRVKAGAFLMIRIALSVGLAQLTAIFVGLVIFGADIRSRIHNADLQANGRIIAERARLVDGDIERATGAVTAQTARVVALAAQVSALRQNEIDPSANDPQMQSAQEEVTAFLARKVKADEEVEAAETFASNEAAGIKGAPGNSGQPGKRQKYRAAMEKAAIARTHAQQVVIELNAARDRLEALRNQLASGNEAARQRSYEQLPAFEAALTAENARLTDLKNELATLASGRDENIRRAVENAPDHVSVDAGFLAQIRALDEMTQEDWKIKAIIALIDFVSFGFELAAVLAKVTSCAPTTLGAMLARDVYMRLVHIVDEMSAELNAYERQEPESPSSAPARDAHERPEGAGTPPQPDLFGNPNGQPPPAAPPKRPRGRPRKSPPAEATAASG